MTVEELKRISKPSRAYQLAVTLTEDNSRRLKFTDNSYCRGMISRYAGIPIVGDNPYFNAGWDRMNMLMEGE